MECPKCRNKMQMAFCARSAGLSCALPEKFDHFIFLDKDLSEAGMKKFIPHSGEWHPSYLCQACKMYIIEYGIIMNRAEVEKTINK